MKQNLTKRRKKRVCSTLQETAAQVGVTSALAAIHGGQQRADCFFITITVSNRFDSNRTTTSIANIITTTSIRSIINSASRVARRNSKPHNNHNVAMPIKCLLFTNSTNKFYCIITNRSPLTSSDHANQATRIHHICTLASMSIVLTPHSHRKNRKERNSIYS